MNRRSPEPGSPTSETSSSESFQGEEPPPTTSRGHMFGGGHIGLLSSIFGRGGDDYGVSGKRRNPASHGIALSRDPKSRRREDVSARKGALGVSGFPVEVLKKDDTVDQHVVDKLRIQLGDPFDDTAIKDAS